MVTGLRRARRSVTVTVLWPGGRRRRRHLHGTGAAGGRDRPGESESESLTRRPGVTNHRGTVTDTVTGAWARRSICRVWGRRGPADLARRRPRRPSPPGQPEPSVEPQPAAQSGVETSHRAESSYVKWDSAGLPVGCPVLQLYRNRVHVWAH